MGDANKVRQLCDYFRRISSELYNEELRAYHDEGGTIIGCLYDQVPEEIIAAAGFLPYRVRAVDSAGDEAADARFTQVNCSLVRHFYDSAVKGRFDFIDGLVASNACDHIRKLHENWTSVLKPEFSHMICFPKKQGEAQVDALAGQIAQLKAAIEQAYDVQITDEALAEAIRVYNRTRELQRKLYDLRAQATPPISGADSLAVMMAATAMPRATYNEKLAELIDACEGAPGIDDALARVYVYGGDIDSLAFIDAIESQGALVVGDSLGGFGKRACDFAVAEDGDLIRNLAQAYLMDRPGEPRLHGTRAARWEYVERSAEACRADGIIQVHIPICDLWSYERLMFDTLVAKKGIPCLNLDTEYIFTNAGQTRTRVQAFVETLTEGGR